MFALNPGFGEYLKAKAYERFLIIILSNVKMIGYKMLKLKCCNVSSCVPAVISK